MSRSLTSRAAAQTALFPRASRCSAQSLRPFSQTASRRDDSKPRPPPGRVASNSVLNDIYGAPSSGPANPMAGLSNSSIFKTLGSQTNIDTSSLMGGIKAPEKKVKVDVEPYHLHIMATKHNTHVTCTKPNREPIISLSSGNLGYRKARRNTFDAAYSLTKYVFDRLIHNGWPDKIDRLELVLRGFGQGRDAAVKVLMSPEGRFMREKIVQVADSTRLKFGGTRSKRARRL